MTGPATYDKRTHAAARTDDYVFHQLIPYLGNKRRLLGLIGQAVDATCPPPSATALDLFAGSGVVARFLKRRGLRVVANDWEPYARPINTCAVACNRAPAFRALGGYEAAIARLNALPPREGWITRHLCPRDDARYDTAVDRMFYMRKNGLRLDAMRQQIEDWTREGVIDGDEAACLLSPLLFQACYTSNTSGVFKGFHNGWGGQTGAALYRIASDLALSPAVFHDNGLDNRVLCLDAQAAAESLRGEDIHLAYLDPPYNQHPYASNYHVLNTLTLWDAPETPATITPGTKSAIRLDWRAERRSAYNYRGEATAAYTLLIKTIRARYVLTSYSTDGMIPLREMIAANLERGDTQVFMQGYKRYRVSSQRFSAKPVNVEFVLVANTLKRPSRSRDEIEESILRREKRALAVHPETRSLCAV
ncbi:MAG TPA: DNA adenine methylase [Candidatus Brocadiia bacterium]|nr:DNA adenine methylase [Candidatus Brocadiia bacterium]